MLNKKEIITISGVVLITTLSISVLELQKTFLPVLLAVFLTVLLNVGVKKSVGYYFDTKIEVELWNVFQYGVKPQRHFKKSIPLGIILTVFSKLFLFPFKNLVWMASLVFEVKPKVYKSAKRHGLYRFSEMTESHLGLIAAAGIIANLILAIIAYFANFTELAMISMFYAFFNMIPVSRLDGNKVFFGNLVLWSFLASLVLIGLFFVIFIV